MNIIKNERDPSLFMSKLLLKFQNILRNATQVIVRHRICLQTDMVKPVYPPTTSLRGGGIKRGSHSDLKADIYSWFIQRKGGTIASPLFCQKTVFHYFENIISLSQRNSRCRNWVTSPRAAKISCCLTAARLFFMLNRPPN